MEKLEVQVKELKSAADDESGTRVSAKSCDSSMCAHGDLACQPPVFYQTDSLCRIPTRDSRVKSNCSRKNWRQTTSSCAKPQSSE